MLFSTFTPFHFSRISLLHVFFKDVYKDNNKKFHYDNIKGNFERKYSLYFQTVDNSLSLFHVPCFFSLYDTYIYVLYKCNHSVHIFF